MPPAFAAPPPARSSFLGGAAGASAARAPPRPANAARGPPPVRARFKSFGDVDKYAAWAAEIFGAADAAAAPRRRAAARVDREEREAREEGEAQERKREKERKRREESVAKVQDFCTMRAGGEDLTAREVGVSGVRCLSAARDVWEVELDVSGTAWEGGHRRPGQFLQVAVGGKVGVFTIASRPETMDGRLSVLVGLGEDPLGLCGLKVGARVRVGVIIGAGFGVEELCAGKRLFLFADCLQGFAAVRSLCDWALFRASSGEGANRRVPVTVFYQMKSSGSLPCAERLAEWSMYGINVVPVVRQSLGGYLEAGGFGSGGFGMAGGQGVAVACVADMHTAEKVFVSLAAGGVKREHFHMFTERRVALELEAYEESDDVGEAMQNPNDVHFSTAAERPRGVPEDIYQEMHRRQVEEEVWQRWVQIRAVMWKEFESTWAHKNPASRSSRASAQEAARQKQAWASWFAHNKDAWGAQHQWEDVSWGSYWSGWQSEQSKWTKDWSAKTEANSWGARTDNTWSATGAAWSQSRSEEFWDAAYGAPGGGGQSYDRYSQGYGGSAGSWGSKSTNRDPGGYQYTYQEPPGGPGSSRYKYNGGSAGGARGGQRQGAYQNGSNQRSYSGGGGGGGGGSAARGGFGSTDFYQVLGVTAGASGAEIKKAYRKAAMANHPDLNPEAGSTERMQNVVIAYMTLKDKSKRSHYDKYGV